MPPARGQTFIIVKEYPGTEELFPRGTKVVVVRVKEDVSVLEVVRWSERNSPNSTILDLSLGDFSKFLGESAAVEDAIPAQPQ